MVELPHSAVCACEGLLPHSADLPQSAALLLPEAMTALFPQTLDADHGPVWPHSGLITAVASPVVVLQSATSPCPTEQIRQIPIRLRWDY